MLARRTAARRSGGVLKIKPAGRSARRESKSEKLPENICGRIWVKGTTPESATRVPYWRSCRVSAEGEKEREQRAQGRREREREKERKFYARIFILALIVGRAGSRCYPSCSGMNAAAYTTGAWRWQHTRKHGSRICKMVARCYSRARRCTRVQLIVVRSRRRLGLVIIDCPTSRGCSPINLRSRLFGLTLSARVSSYRGRGASVQKSVAGKL